MARTSGRFTFFGQNRGSGGMYVTWENLDVVRIILANTEDGLRTTANREMRQGTVKIANEVVIPALKQSAASSGVPIAPAMADTMRAKSDRVVTVRVGAVNPKLSGFKRGVGEGRAKKTGNQHLKWGSATSRNYRTTLAWGSEMGPGSTSHGNHYAVARNESGYWVQPGINSNGTLEKVKAAYAKLLDSIIEKYSRYR